MQPTPEELRASYAAMTDGELLRIAGDFENLLGFAQDAIEQELRLRGLSVAHAKALREQEKPREPSPDILDMEIVTIRRFRDLSEAMVARSVMESAGIPCFLRDENTIRVAWQFSNLLGGISLQVRARDLEAAEAMLTRVDAATMGIPSEDEPERFLEPDVVCPRCGSEDVQRRHRWGGLAVASTWLLSSPSRGPQEWTCVHCGNRWTEASAEERYD